MGGAPFPGGSPTYSATSLISSDPKHALGQYHATHFNEWNQEPEGNGAPEGVQGHGTLPQLDTEVVDQILET